MITVKEVLQVLYEENPLGEPNALDIGEPMSIMELIIINQLTN